MNYHKDMRPVTKYIKDNYDISKPLVGVEIGVKSGTNSISILESLPIEKLYLIDPFDFYKRQGFIQKEEKIFDKRMEPYVDKVVVIKEKSIDAIDRIPDELDFIYIDGCHDLNIVKDDIRVYYPKVKKGGIFGGHDYTQKPGVFRAVNRFVKEYNYELHKEMSYFPTVNKGATDWWVIK